MTAARGHARLSRYMMPDPANGVPSDVPFSAPPDLMLPRVASGGALGGGPSVGTGGVGTVERLPPGAAGGHHHHGRGHYMMPSPGGTYPHLRPRSAAPPGPSCLRCRVRVRLQSPPKLPARAPRTTPPPHTSALPHTHTQVRLHRRWSRQGWEWRGADTQATPGGVGDDGRRGRVCPFQLRLIINKCCVGISEAEQSLGRPHEPLARDSARESPHGPLGLAWGWGLLVLWPGQGGRRRLRRRAGPAPGGFPGPAPRGFRGADHQFEPSSRAAGTVPVVFQVPAKHCAIGARQSSHANVARRICGPPFERYTQ